MARPALFGEPASETIRVRVTPTQRRDLVQVAQANHTDVAGVIREAVNEFVSDYRDRPCFAVLNKKPAKE